MKVGSIRFSDIGHCPKHSMLPQHYMDDGTCYCTQADAIKEQIAALQDERREKLDRANQVQDEIKALERKL